MEEIAQFGGGGVRERPPPKHNKKKNQKPKKTKKKKKKKTKKKHKKGGDGTESRKPCRVRVIYQPSVQLAKRWERRRRGKKLNKRVRRRRSALKGKSNSRLHDRRGYGGNDRKRDLGGRKTDVEEAQGEKGGRLKRRKTSERNNRHATNDGAFRDFHITAWLGEDHLTKKTSP